MHTREISWSVCVCVFISHAGSVGQLSVSSETLLSRTSDGNVDKRTHTSSSSSSTAVQACLDMRWLVSFEGMTQKLKGQRRRFLYTICYMAAVYICTFSVSCVSKICLINCVVNLAVLVFVWFFLCLSNSILGILEALFWLRLTSF